MNLDEKGRVHFKIILWGPFGSGKTTIIKWYYDNASGLNRGGFTSVENDLGQTIYFDYASLSRDGGVIYDFFAVGGSDECKRERRALAEGADAVIFVAHSQREQLESTLSSIDELVSSLGKLYDSILKVFVLNKRDLLTEDLVEEGEFSELPDVQDSRVFETVATIGVGVTEAFQYVISGLAQRMRAPTEIPGIPVELKGIGLGIMNSAEGFEPSLEAVYPETFSIGPDDVESIASTHVPSPTSASFATVRTEKTQICSYHTGKRDRLGASHIVCLVLPSSTRSSTLYSLFQRFYDSAPVILRYVDSTSSKGLIKTLPQFYILARDLIVSRTLSKSEPPTFRPRDLLRCGLITQGASGAMGTGVSYLGLVQDQQGYDLIFSPSKTKGMYISSVQLDEYETKTTLKEVERIQNNLSARLRATSESGSRRRHVRAFLGEIGETVAEIFRTIFNSIISEKLNEDNPESLALEVDRHLFAIPLEILHDGQNYLCLRRPFSRWITEEQGAISADQKPKLVPRSRSKGDPISILIIDSRLRKIPPASPDDFAGRLIRFLTGKGAFRTTEVNVQSARGELKKEEVRVLLSSGKFDIIHMIGPAEISSGDPAGSSWVFSNGEIRGYELAEILGGRYPGLVISQVSSPLHEREWDAGQESRILYSLALSTIAAGTECFIGEVAQQLTENTLSLTIDVYREMLENKKPIGEAIRSARLNFIRANALEDSDWIRPVLYGNPAKKI